MKQSLEQLIQKSKFNWVNENINSKNFPDQGKDEKVELVKMSNSWTKDEVLKVLKEKGMRPATVRELVNFHLKNPKNTDYVVALGQEWLGPDGDPGVVYLWGRAGRRGLHLGWAGRGWRSNTLVAGVRELSLDTKTLSSSDLDSSVFDRLEELEKFQKRVEKLINFNE